MGEFLHKMINSCMQLDLILINPNRIKYEIYPLLFGHLFKLYIFFLEIWWVPL